MIDNWASEGLLMGQTEEIKMMSSRNNRFTYTPITRGHKPTASQESNTLSTMSEVSAITTVSLDSEGGQSGPEGDPSEPRPHPTYNTGNINNRLSHFAEEDERSPAPYRSGSEETVDTVVTVTNKKLRGAASTQPHANEKRMKSRNSDYGSYCGSPGLTSAKADSGECLDSSIESVKPGAPLLSESDSDTSDHLVAHSLCSGQSPHSHNPSVKLALPGTHTRERRNKRIPGEPVKTLVSGLFLGTGFLATTTSLAFTHERVPDIEPLPDLLLDHIRYQSWGLDVSEVLLMVNTLTAVLVILVHSHRCIILRRIWFILGLLYYYRALTMAVTVLPKADVEYQCLPRQNQTTAMMYVERVLTIISGGGLSINGKHVFCGDYIFSGHTMTLTLGYLAIKEYSPRRFALLHWTSFLAAFCGVIFLLLARGHYTIDVMLAYYVSSRLWWVYHTMAHNDSLKEAGPHNQLSSLCWWNVFRFFETKHSGPLPRRFSLPLPRRFKRWFRNFVGRHWASASNSETQGVSSWGRRNTGVEAGGGGGGGGGNLQSVSCQDLSSY